MTDNPATPGCFGSAICFQAESPECRSCLFKAACEPAAELRASQLRAEFGITKPKRITKPPAPRVEPGFEGERIHPKKVDELLRRIELMGVRVYESLSKGENPFATRPLFLRLTCHLLLRRPGGVTRAELMRGLAVKLNWTEGTAGAHATQAFQALKALGAAHEVNGYLMLKKED